MDRKAYSSSTLTRYFPRYINSMKKLSTQILYKRRLSYGRGRRRCTLVGRQLF